MEEFIVGGSFLILTVLTSAVIFFAKTYNSNKAKDLKLKEKEKELSVKNQVIILQKEIIEHQANTFPLNHDN